jgi:hypothetical protein
MKLPQGERAIVPVEKLTGYCLNPNHDSGKHKARVFASALGITAANAEVLRALILTAAIEGEVVQQANTAFGRQFKVDWQVPDTDGVVLRTIWKLPSELATPQLISAFIR